MKLLQHSENTGYPAEYLVSRLKGRRSRFIRDWKELVFNAAPEEYLSSSRYQGFVKEHTPEAVWMDLIKENRWLYMQMNEELRRIFSPYFLYAELRTIFIWLRHSMHGKKTGRTTDLLKSSLLSDEIKKMFASNPDTVSAVSSLERAFASLSGKFAGLSSKFETDGLRGLEQQITNTYLAVTAESRVHPVLKEFFQRLIDARNIMSIYKCIRLEQTSEPPVIPGGRIPESRLKAVVISGDSFGVGSLIRKFFNITIETPDPTRVEIALYSGVTQFLKKKGREQPVVGIILDYLWKCSLQVMNLSVVLTGKDLERDTVIGEIVQ